MKRGAAALLSVLVVVLLALAVMGGFFLGRNTVAGPVRIITQSSIQAAQSPEQAPESGEEAAASSGSRSPEGSGSPKQSEPVEGSESPEEEQNSFPVNINTATAEELQTLPGIGETRSKAIVAYREEHGPFTYVEDLRGVSGIGDGILANIIDYITVGEQGNG